MEQRVKTQIVNPAREIQPGILLFFFGGGDDDFFPKASQLSDCFRFPDRNPTSEICLTLFVLIWFQHASQTEIVTTVTMSALEIFSSTPKFKYTRVTKTVSESAQFLSSPPAWVVPRRVTIPFCTCSFSMKVLRFGVLSDVKPMFVCTLFKQAAPNTALGLVQ